MACEVGIVCVSIFRPKASLRGVTPADEAWEMNVQPLPRAATLPPPARPAKARGTPSGVHRSLPKVSVKTDYLHSGVHVAWWRAVFPQPEGGSLSEGPLSSAADFQSDHLSRLALPSFWVRAS